MSEERRLAREARRQKLSGQGEYLRGSDFAAWLRKDFPGSVAARTGRGDKTGFARNLYRWEHEPGARISIYTADRVMVDMGLHIHLIPEEFFIDAENRSYSPEQRERAMQTYRETGSIALAARLTGATVSAIQKWANKERAAA